MCELSLRTLKYRGGPYPSGPSSIAILGPQVLRALLVFPHFFSQSQIGQKDSTRLGYSIAKRTVSPSPPKPSSCAPRPHRLQSQVLVLRGRIGQHGRWDAGHHAGAGPREPAGAQAPPAATQAGVVVLRGRRQEVRAGRPDGDTGLRPLRLGRFGVHRSGGAQSAPLPVARLPCFPAPPRTAAPACHRHPFLPTARVWQVAMRSLGFEPKAHEVSSGPPCWTMAHGGHSGIHA